MAEQCAYWGHGSSGSAFASHYQIPQSIMGTSFFSSCYLCDSTSRRSQEFHHKFPFDWSIVQRSLYAFPYSAHCQFSASCCACGKWPIHTQFQCKLAGSNVEGKQRSLRSVLPAWRLLVLRLRSVLPARRLLVLIYLNDGGLCIRTEPTEFCVSHSCGPKWLMCVWVPAIADCKFVAYIF